MDARAVLADVARLGPFFTVSTRPAEAADPTWRPVRDLRTDPAPLRARTAHVRRVLGCDGRVAASIAFQGVAAVVVSAPVAAAVVHGVLPRLTPTALRWRPTASGPWLLWCPAPVADPVPDPDDAADALSALLGEHLVALVAAVREQESVSGRVLWGNAASAVAAAGQLVAGQRPAAAERAAEVVRRLLATDPLAGTGELLPAAGGAVPAFRRRSCCLYHRVPGGGLCGDCVLHSRPR